MYRFIIGSEAGDPASFSVPFPGGEISLSNPKQLFVLSPSHIAVPAMGLTTAIAQRIPFIEPAPVTSFPSMSDTLGAGVTRSHIGLPLAGAETAAMSRLNIEGPVALRDWGGELIFTS